MAEYKTCSWCGGKMVRREGREVFLKDGKEYPVPDATFFQCTHCGDKVFEAEEARRIDAMLRAQPLFE